MPSTETITAFYSFTPGNVIYSSQVNNNFSIFRGHFIPVDPTAASFANNTYDLGSSSFRWRKIFGKPWPNVVSTTGSMTLTNTNEVVLMNSTAATITATLPTVVGSTGLSFYIKNIGTSNTVLVDGNGTELIDNTLTINLISMEAICLISDGANLWGF